ncbi:hypothetical protein [Nannocystis bainbridge]|uniref:Uncharacterized protein n=1 Tax=Nannocystis bainbridge TaxID=2995303 RepID=A0ABT5E5T3_9BACT|nr:hypothetical protein [Nannocystis bainbridge]MDC0720770.1 hypothetical protein [Nannocystis bainbridge]
MVSVVSVWLLGAGLQPIAGAQDVAPAPETAPAGEMAPAPETAAVADPFTPLDTEVPEPAGMGRQYREYRNLEGITGMDLSGAWESYEEDVEEDGETDTFLEFAKRRFRVRRGLGIGVTFWGIAAIGPAIYFWVETARTELFEGKAMIGIAAAATTSAAFAAMIAGSMLWNRWAVPLRDLRDVGLARRGRPIVAPLPLPRGLGLGLRVNF